MRLFLYTKTKEQEEEEEETTGIFLLNSENIWAFCATNEKMKQNSQ